MTSPGRLEYAARYTHTHRDGRTIQVTNTHHEHPGDRAWAVERMEEMVRAQQALGRTVDAHLVTRYAATEWVPERLGPFSADRPALDAALAVAPSCYCEFVDIGVGMQRVTEDPECPVHTREGAAAWYLRIFTPYIVAAEHARIKRLLHARIETVTYGASRDQDHSYKQGLADAFTLIKHASADGEPERVAPSELEPGSEIPGQPGYVVGTCGHRLAGSEWRAGFRTCERCPVDAPAISVDAAAHVLFHIGAGGWPGSRFIQNLLKAFETADSAHRRRLGAGFPEYAAAVEEARGGGPGVEHLLDIVAQDEDA